jgi:intein/homing endonuclease
MPALPINPTPQQLAEAYDDGMEGWIWDKEAQQDWEVFMEEQGDPDDLLAPIKDSHKAVGRALLYRSREKYDPGAFGKEAQKGPDCFIAGTMVRMANGTEKSIEDIKEGEYVVSHNNQIRKVISTVKKPYRGKLATIKVVGSVEEITSTADHKFLSFPNIPCGANANGPKQSEINDKTAWIKAKDISKNLRLLIPKSSPEKTQPCLKIDVYDFINEEYVKLSKSTKPINRFIKVDEELCWLIGIYTAEGHISKKAVEWSLHRKETHFAKRICDIILDKFGIRCTLQRLPSKPNVLIVSCASKLVKAVIKKLVPGDCYTKRTHPIIFRSSIGRKLAYIRGWLDGDGHVQFGKRSNSKHYYAKVSGVSASPGLIRDLFQLSISCDLRTATVQKKKQKHQRVGSQELHFYGSNALAMYPEEAATCRVKVAKSNRAVTKLGLALPVESITFSKIIETTVYCIEVEEDHSFIANTFAVHNCTSHGDRSAYDVTRSVEIDIKGEAEEYFLRSVTEFGYGMRGSRGGGSSPGVLARAKRDYGTLFRQKYESLGLDLSTYTYSIGANWGGRGVPESVKQEAKKHPIGELVVPKSLDQTYDLLANGYAGHSGQQWACSSSQPEDGINRKRGTWNHDMATVGYDRTREIFKENVFFVPQSWGEWCPPNKVWVKHIDILGPYPTGMIVVPEDDYDRYFVRSGSIYFYGKVTGFPAQKLPNYGTQNIIP